MTRTLTLLAPCFNERKNVALLYQRVAGVVAGLSGVACELVFIDNASTDGTQAELRKLVVQTERKLKADCGLRSSSTSAILGTCGRLITDCWR